MKLGPGAGSGVVTINYVDESDALRPRYCKAREWTRSPKDPPFRRVDQAQPERASKGQKEQSCNQRSPTIYSANSIPFMGSCPGCRSVRLFSGREFDPLLRDHGAWKGMRDQQNGAILRQPFRYFLSNDLHPFSI